MFTNYRHDLNVCELTHDNMLLSAVFDISNMGAFRDCRLNPVHSRMRALGSETMNSKFKNKSNILFSSGIRAEYSMRFMTFNNFNLNKSNGLPAMTSQHQFLCTLCFVLLAESPRHAKWLHSRPKPIQSCFPWSPDE